MIRYTLDDTTRAIMKKFHRQVQAGIAIEASKLIGQEISMPFGIAKYEGGVVVNGREICIKRDVLFDDWIQIPNEKEPTPEEMATFQAIDIVATVARKNASELVKYGCVFKGCDPLRSMLNQGESFSKSS